MGSICAEQHKLFPSHQLLSPKKSSSTFKDLEIPPRKLLHSKKSHQDHNIMTSSLPYEFEYSNLRIYLPYNDNTVLDKEGTTGNNDDSDEDELDPYSSDHFRMYEFKVHRCTRSRSHDWTDCPFAHPGEKARRRDPRRYHYSGTVCPEFRRGGCSRGDNCEFSHGVFECWLHPSRYRTEACKDGRNCKRKVCFFAHTPRQLRLLPELLSSSSAVKYDKPSCLHHLSPCRCLVCHSVTSSPTSTLLGMSHLSPSLSPPLSPMKHRSSPGFSPISRYNDRLSKFRSGTGCYKDALTELMDSLEAMGVNESAASPLSNVSSSNSTNPWIDTTSFGGVDQDQTQFILSPSTPAASELSNRNRGGNNFFINDGNDYCFGKRFVEENNGVGSTASHDPDLGWVNDLLM